MQYSPRYSPFGKALQGLRQVMKSCDENDNGYPPCWHFPCDFDIKNCQTSNQTAPLVASSSSISPTRLYSSSSSFNNNNNNNESFKGIDLSLDKWLYRIRLPGAPDKQPMNGYARSVLLLCLRTRYGSYWTCLSLQCHSKGWAAMRSMSSNDEWW